MAGHCSGTSAAGKWSDSSPGCKISAAYWYATTTIPRITGVLSSLVVLSSSCGGIYEMVFSYPKDATMTQFAPHDKFYLSLGGHDLKYRFPFLDESMLT